MNGKMLGFIGLGAMGKHMASNLLKAGHPMFVYDASPPAMEFMREQGAVPCSGVADLAERADFVLLSLPNGKIVESVVKGESGLFAHRKPGMCVVDTSTVSPATSRSLAEAARTVGIRFADAPVSGGVSGAEAGTLTVMVGCEDDLYAELLPILGVIGRNFFHVGDPGAGNAMKIVNNLLLGANMASLAEALTLGAKLGLKTTVMSNIISVSSGRSYALETRLDSRILTGNYEGGFAIDLQYKDLKLAMEAAGDVSAPIPMAASAAMVYEAARAQGMNRLDIAAVVRVWEALNGVQVTGGDDTSTPCIR